MVAAFLLGGMLWADCPTPQGSTAWSSGVSAGYSFNVGVGGPPPDSMLQIDWSTLPSTIQDITEAMNLWTNANQGNVSVVHFNYNGVYQNNWTGGPYYIHAWHINYPGSDLDPGIAAYTSTAVLMGTTIVVQANTSFYYGSISPLTQAAPLDTQSPGYDGSVVRIMLHEVGHTMGLRDQPLRAGSCAGQVAGESVMNVNCETNDSAHNIAPSPTSCDNQSVW
jgi:hypothetical protein